MRDFLDEIGGEAGALSDAEPQSNLCAALAPGHLL
jgi:hypothetical protein